MEKSDYIMRINGAGRVVCPLDWYWDTSPGLEDYDLLVFLAGRGWYCIDGAEYEVTAGHVLLLRKGTCCVARMDVSDPMTVIFAHFNFYDTDTGALFEPDESDLPPLHTVLANPLFFRGLAERIIQAQSADAAQWLSAAFLELQAQKPQPKWTGLEKQQSEIIESACFSMRNQPEDNFPLESLAASLHCTMGHATRLFRKYTGVTPREFRIQARIEAARAMLLQSSLPIAVIAAQLNFSDVYAFSRQFRQKVGVPPGAFRKRSSLAQLRQSSKMEKY